MITSTMLQWKISKTKKRLSNDNWTLQIIVLSFCALSILMIGSFRALTVGAKFGAVSIDLPIFDVKSDDSGVTSGTKVYEIGPKSPTVILTVNAFYIGSLQAMSREFMDTDNKYIVRHESGAPQMDRLFDIIAKWEFQNPVPDRQKVFVLVPQGEVPYPIVAQVVDQMKRKFPDNRFVLSTGIL
jgi:hypothetical protein